MGRIKPNPKSRKNAVAPLNSEISFNLRNCLTFVCLTKEEESVSVDHVYRIIFEVVDSTAITYKADTI